MLIGYCRSMPTVGLDPTDIEGGGTQNQESVLRAAGCKKFFIDSNKTAQKLVMREAALDFIRENDVLVVTSIDRVVRSSCELMELMQQLANHGATLRVLMFGGAVLDTSDPSSKPILRVLSAVSDWETALQSERPKLAKDVPPVGSLYRGRYSGF